MLGVLAGGYVHAVLPLDWDLAGAIPVLPFGTLCPKDTFGLAIVSINAILVLPFGGGFLLGCIPFGVAIGYACPPLREGYPLLIDPCGVALGFRLLWPYCGFPGQDASAIIHTISALTRVASERGDSHEFSGRKALGPKWPPGGRTV